MSAVAQPVSIGAGAKLGEAVIQGKVLQSRKLSTQSGPLRLTLLKLAAVDEFESAPTIEVRSVNPVGEVGSVVKLRVSIGGYARSYKRTGDDGESYTVRTAENRLTVIEA